MFAHTKAMTAATSRTAALPCLGAQELAQRRLASPPYGATSALRCLQRSHAHRLALLYQTSPLSSGRSRQPLQGHQAGSHSAAVLGAEPISPHSGRRGPRTLCVPIPGPTAEPANACRPVTPSLRVAQQVYWHTPDGRFTLAALRDLYTQQRPQTGRSIGAVVVPTTAMTLCANGAFSSQFDGPRNIREAASWPRLLLRPAVQVATRALEFQ